MRSVPRMLWVLMLCLSLSALAQNKGKKPIVPEPAGGGPVVTLTEGVVTVQVNSFGRSGHFRVNEPVTALYEHTDFWSMPGAPVRAVDGANCTIVTPITPDPGDPMRHATSTVQCGGATGCTMDFDQRVSGPLQTWTTSVSISNCAPTCYYSYTDYDVHGPGDNAGSWAPAAGGFLGQFVVRNNGIMPNVHYVFTDRSGANHWDQRAFSALRTFIDGSACAPLADAPPLLSPVDWTGAFQYPGGTTSVSYSHGRDDQTIVGSPIPFIDLKCYAITGEPLNRPLVLTHLNPLFRQLGFPPEQVIVMEPQQLCVPVQKNNQPIPPPILDLIQYIDLKCYGISGDALNRDFVLTHLNEVLRRLGLPPEYVTVLDPAQLCVPVRKNQQPIPGAILELIQYLDLKCYNIIGEPLPVDVTLRLDHLNRVLLERPPSPPETVTLMDPQKLCVPVQKNNQPIPIQVLQLIQDIDLKCYGITGDPLNRDLLLEHLNRVLLELGAPPELVTLFDPQNLCVPVSKSLP